MDFTELSKLNDTEEHKDEVQTTVVRINWGKTISDGLLWLNERAWPLGGGVLFISILYLHNYIQYEQVPLSITSPAFITALPVLFAMLIFIIALLASLILLPTAMLFMPMIKGETPQIESIGFDSSNPEAYNRPRRDLAFRWLGGLVVVGVFWCLIVFVGPVKDADPSFQLLGFLLTLVFFIIVVNLGQFPSANRWREVSPDYVFLCLISSVIQVLIILFAFTISEILSSQYRSSLIIQMFSMLGALLCLWLFQILGAHLVLNVSKHQNPIAYVTLIGAVLIGALGLIPPVSANLASYVFQMSASGGKPCATFVWSHDFAGGVSALNGLQAGQSKDLRILAEADGYYLVRAHATESKAVTRVPQAAVETIDECPAPDVAK